MKSDDDLIADIETFFERARTHSDKWRAQARENYDFASLVQWSEDDARELRDQGRPAVTFSRINSTINAVSGAEVSNRQEVRYIPRETGDAKINEILTAAAKWVRDECNAEDEESDSFRDLIVCGMGWTETHVEYDEDPDGKVYIDRVDPIEMYWDPASKKQNLADARWIMRVKRWSREALVARWGAERIDSIIADLQKSEWDVDADDDQPEPHDATNAWRYEGDDASAQSRIPAYRVIEYQWFEMERVYRVPNPTTGQLEDVPAEVFAKVRDKFDAMGIPYTDVKKRCAYRSFALGKSILEKDKGPAEDRFTITCMTGYRDRNRGYWFALVDLMKDPQRWANKFFSQILHVVNSNAKGGLLVEQGATKSVENLREEWARPDGVVELNAGGLAKVREKPFAPYPTGLDRMMEVAVSAIRDVTGVNLEMLGLADRTQAGVLEYQRKQAGLTILATLFDALRRYRKDQGRVLLTFIRKYIADGRLVRVVGDAGAQFVPLTKMSDTIRYDVVVDDSPTSPNQKEQVFGVMAQLLPMLEKLGVMPPLEVLDYSPLPTSLVEKWKQAIAQRAEQPDPEAVKAQAEAQKLQMQAQSEQVRLQADAQKAQADAQSQAIDVELKVKELEFRAEEMRAELAKVATDADLKRRETDAKIEAERASIQIEMAKLALEQERIALDREKMNREPVGAE